MGNAAVDEGQGVGVLGLELVKNFLVLLVAFYCVLLYIFFLVIF